MRWRHSLAGGLTALCVLGIAPDAAAESHGWEAEPVPTLGSVLRAGWIPAGTALSDGTLVTLWRKPGGVDESKTDFLGNPLRFRPRLLRCIEQRDEDGMFRLERCELSR